MDEAVPEAFVILPHYEKGIVIGFTVLDPGDTIRGRGRLVAAIHKEYPGVSIGELDNARISYNEYHADVVLLR
jgi:hypothetical protein